MEFCMQTLSRISPNRDLAVDELYNSMSIYRNLAVRLWNCFVYSGGDHVQSLYPSTALGRIIVRLIILIISNTIKSKNNES